MSFLDTLIQSENLRQDLIYIRNTMADDEIQEIISNDAFLLSLLGNEDSKIRKVVAEILGKTENEKYYPILLDAYKNESQHMIRP